METTNNTSDKMHQHVSLQCSTSSICVRMFFVLQNVCVTYVQVNYNQ